MTQEGSPGSFDGVLVGKAVASSATSLDKVAIYQSIEFGHLNACPVDDVCQVSAFLGRLGSHLDGIADVVQYDPQIGYLGE